MTHRTRLVAVAGVSVLVALGGCSNSEPAASKSDSSGPPACSGWANGEKITEQLSLAGCTGDGVTGNASTTCTAAGAPHTALAVGPVYGFVGKPAHYLGDGKDATKSPEWKKFQQDCPYASE